MCKKYFCLRKKTNFNSNQDSNEGDNGERRYEMGNIYRLTKLNASYREQQRKPPNSNPDI